ncbi:ATP-binding cassette domain-containing protein [Pinibacter aurantiacus]|uniref:ATP-binding cassette domain-containing protein n=1 Tax=Pinibacter aurantiacus TaxID=2851599 RepID=A0A9E2SFF0_9BACT|nr:ATP-binding cassette domain-containing protein [Pinibacter aurantiacus]MBV4360035.1 ATP-binding cassette domain-containing protein [Pinibacter aurantiacus]
MTTTSTIVNNIKLTWLGKAVLDNISFTLNKGEHLMITGVSGSGKTLLAKAIAGKIFHEGTIAFHDDDGNAAQPHIIMVDQHYHFKNRSNVSTFYYQQRFNSMDAQDAATVREELENCAAVQTDDNPSLHADNYASLETDNYLSLLDMAHRIDAPLLQLSSGEHKRFQIIKALLQKPDVLILDEPFVGLDIETRKKLKTLINELAANGTTFIIICDHADVPSAITHVAYLQDGHLKEFAPAKSFDFLPAVASNTVRTVQTDNYPSLQCDFSTTIEMKNVSVKYGEKEILHNIDWKVNRGEKWLLKGHNGAGKSTLLSLITGDNPQAYANEIYLFDKRRGSGESIWDIKKNIGYVSPELQWYFDNTVNCFQAVASGLFDTIGLFKHINKEQEEQVNKWLDYFELTAYGSKLLSALSASQQRLALLARAMVKNPPLLILDEPCQGLDQLQKNNFIELVDALCEDDQRTLIYVSHYAEEVPAAVNKMILLEHGKATIQEYPQKNLLTA